MKCRFCGVELAPLRAVSDGVFCSTRHRKSFEQSQGEEIAPEIASALIPLDWWSFDPAAPISEVIPDPTDSAPLYPGRPELQSRGKVTFPIHIPAPERLLTLPSILPFIAAEPEPIELMAWAVESVPDPDFPRWKIEPVGVAISKLQDRLLRIPFDGGPVAAEAKPLELLAGVVDFVQKTDLPRWRIEPAGIEVSELQDRLFSLPFITPLVAAEPGPSDQRAEALDIVKKPHLLLCRIAASTVPLSELLPAPPEEIAPPVIEEVQTPAWTGQEAAAASSIAEVVPARPACEESAPSVTPAFAAVSESPAAKPLSAEPVAAAIEEAAPPPASAGEPAEEALPGSRERATPELAWWTRLPRMWGALPVHVRALAMVTPIALILAFSRALPSVPGTSGSNGVQIQKVLTQGLGSVRQQLASRAAVDFMDDFRTGLDDWQGRGNTTADWSYDATGFVRPAKLALFRPTLTLQDYRFEFLGEIDEKAMGCVFRATDPDNYYAVKFAVSNPGPMPLVKLVRYAVVNGKEERHEERPLPFLSRIDTLYRVLIDVRGNDFTIMSQGKVVDFWTDDRLKAGGVGLFCGRGERARVRWVEVSHQYDTLGRLCAYLAPYSVQGRTGSLN